MLPPAILWELKYFFITKLKFGMTLYRKRRYLCIILWYFFFKSLICSFLYSQSSFPVASICFMFRSCQGKQLWNGLFDRHSLPDAPVCHYIDRYLQMENEHRPCTCDVPPIFCICCDESSTGIPHHRLRGYHGICRCSVMVLQPMMVRKDLAKFSQVTQRCTSIRKGAQILYIEVYIHLVQANFFPDLEKRDRICVYKPVW